MADEARTESQKRPASPSVSEPKRAKEDIPEEEEEDGTEVEVKPPSAESTLTVRCLVSKSVAGAIIGKQGAVISDIRKRSGATVNLSESVTTGERVLTIVGAPLEFQAALALVCGSVVNSQKEANASAETAYTVKLQVAVPQTKAGALIGPKGARLQELRDKTTASIKLQREPLPMSTERPCDVQGSQEAVAYAVFNIANTISQVPDSGNTILYNPAQHQPQVQYQQQYPAAPAQPQGPLHTQTLTVSKEMAGAVIGKRGAVIQEIRHVSQAQIKISDPNPATPNDRTITITGQPEQCQVAVYLIHAKMQEAVLQNTFGAA
eukprot:m.267280 g.267280  ORF g.267280 m.267280 type:complete len:321 (+) comp32820_c0_seq1:23-985(+)